MKKAFFVFLITGFTIVMFFITTKRINAYESSGEYLILSESEAENLKLKEEVKRRQAEAAARESKKKNPVIEEVVALGNDILSGGEGDFISSYAQRVDIEIISYSDLNSVSFILADENKREEVKIGKKEVEIEDIYEEIEKIERLSDDEADKLTESSGIQTKEERVGRQENLCSSDEKRVNVESRQSKDEETAKELETVKYTYIIEKEKILVESIYKTKLSLELAEGSKGVGEITVSDKEGNLCKASTKYLIIEGEKEADDGNNIDLNIFSNKDKQAFKEDKLITNNDIRIEAGFSAKFSGIKTFEWELFNIKNKKTEEREEDASLIDSGGFIREEEKSFGKIYNIDGKVNFYSKDLEEGEYRFVAKGCDNAGYEVVEEVCFEIDKSKPEIIFDEGGISKSFNKTVGISVKIKDKNIDHNSIQYTLTGEKTGEIKYGTFDVQEKSLDKSEKNIEFIDIYDDLSGKLGDKHLPDDKYTLRIEVKDLAGFKAAEELEFIVNRNGSVFIFESDISGTFMKEAEDITIKEFNIDNISGKDRRVVVSNNGLLKKLEEGKGFVLEAGKKDNLKTYTYKVLKENFKENGIYFLNIDTKDRAGNFNIFYKNESKGIKLGIDSVSPVIKRHRQVKTLKSKELPDSGDNAEEDSDASYLSYEIIDNLSLEEISVYMDGLKIEIEEEKRRSFMPLKENIFEFSLAAYPRKAFDVELPRDGKSHIVEVTAKDKAGNEAEHIFEADKEKLLKEEKRVDEYFASAADDFYVAEGGNYKNEVMRDGVFKLNFIILFTAIAAGVIAAGAGIYFAVREINERRGEK